MDVELNPIEQRVLGCLIEKEMSTPEYYPLTLNALVNACNQKSNRHPVMELDTATVEHTLYELRMEHKLAVEVSVSGSRVMKYRHNLSELGCFSLSQMAILCELLIRGPQTPGDLRAHSSRLHALTDSNEVELILDELKNHEDGCFVVQLPRQPGKRERRWAHLFGGEPEIVEEQPEIVAGAVDVQAGPSRIERIQTLEYEVGDLRQEVADLKKQFEAFKKAFE
ncbi:YceH family protein [Pontiella sp.]|uniref:YceH family protein n=2 Tax=Pontiella sp. TaxID=2837462 RepID=UPI0035637FC0